MTLTDDVLEEVFGPPKVAAADLHELRAWAGATTALTPNQRSSQGRELCRSIDPTWPARALTNEKVTIEGDARLRPHGRVVLGENTLESMAAIARGVKVNQRKIWAKDFRQLWPAQAQSWRTWRSMLADRTPNGSSELLSSEAAIPSTYFHPAEVMMAVREMGSPWTIAVANEMVLDRTVWKFAAIPFPGDGWFAGLSGFPRSALDLFPDGELADWLRSVVCNGWMTSHQLAWVMGLADDPRGARSTRDSWIAP